MVARYARAGDDSRARRVQTPVQTSYLACTGNAGSLARFGAASAVVGEELLATADDQWIDHQPNQTESLI